MTSLLLMGTQLDPCSAESSVPSLVTGGFCSGGVAHPEDTPTPHRLPLLKNQADRRVVAEAGDQPHKTLRRERELLSE